ncbi:unnamed protein product, partial [Prorocentrum cordatum]
ESAKYGKHCIMIEGSGGVRSLLYIGLLNGFWDLPVSYLKRLCDYKGWDVGCCSITGVLTALAKHILPVFSESVLLSILMRRIKTMDAVEHIEDMLELEWVADICDKGVADELHQQAAAARAHKSLRSEVLSDYHELKVKVGGKPVTNVKHNRHPLYGHRFPPNPPSPEDDLDQAQAKLYLPPGAYLWRANTHGQWRFHMPKYEFRGQASWSAFGGSSFEAMRDCLKRTWERFLEKHKLPK